MVALEEGNLNSIFSLSYKWHQFQIIAHRSR